MASLGIALRCERRYSERRSQAHTDVSKTWTPKVLRALRCTASTFTNISCKFMKLFAHFAYKHGNTCTFANSYAHTFRISLQALTVVQNIIAICSIEWPFLMWTTCTCSDAMRACLNEYVIGMLRNGETDVVYAQCIWDAFIRIQYHSFILIMQSRECILFKLCILKYRTLRHATPNCMAWDWIKACYISPVHARKLHMHLSAGHVYTQVLYAYAPAQSDSHPARQAIMQ